MKNPLAKTPKELKYPAMNEAIQKVVSGVYNGNTSALETHVTLKAFQYMIKKILELTDEEARLEAGRYSQDDRQLFGSQFFLTQGYTKYDYTSDSEYAALEVALKARKEVLLEAAKAAEKGLTVLDPETSEVLNPPDISGGTKESLKVTFREL